MCNNEEVSGPGDSCLHSCPSGTVVKTVGFGARQAAQVQILALPLPTLDRLLNGSELAASSAK